MHWHSYSIITSTNLKSGCLKIKLSWLWRQVFCQNIDEENVAKLSMVWYFPCRFLTISYYSFRSDRSLSVKVWYIHVSLNFSSLYELQEKVPRKKSNRCYIFTDNYGFFSFWLFPSSVDTNSRGKFARRFFSFAWIMLTQIHSISAWLQHLWIMTEFFSAS